MKTYKVTGSHRTERIIKTILGRDPDIHSGMLGKGRFCIKATGSEYQQLIKSGIKISIDKRFI